MWVYRVMRQETGDKDEPYIFGIHEVYDFKFEGKRMHLWTKDRMEPHGTTLKALRSDFAFMRKAFQAPVLDYKTGKPIRKGRS